MKKALFLLTFFLLAFNGFSQADLKVINSDYKNYYVNGTTNTYTITVVNLGPLPATNVNVSNGIPSGVTNFNWTGPNGTSGINTPVGDIVPTLAVGQTLTYIVNFTVPANLSGSLKSETFVTSTTTDPNPVCDQCADIDTKAINADIVVTNTDNKLYYSPGTSSVYTVKVTNNGPLDASNVKVSNPIPVGITQFSWTGSNASAGTDSPLNNTIPLLKNGETVTYTITLQVPAGFTGSLTSQTSTTSDTPDPNPACVDCIDTDTLLSGADIVVTNTDGKTTYTAGGTNTYTVKVENKGPQDATAVVVTNTLPAGINAANVSWTGNGTSGSGFLNDTIATLAVGQSVTYSVVVQIPTTFSGSLTNQVSALSSTADPFPATNQVTDTDTQANATDIVVVNTDNTDIYTPGTTTIYKVTVTNNGPIAATTVAVKDLVPAGIPLGNVTWTGSNGSSGTGNLNNTISTLAVKQTVTYTVTVAIPAGFTGDLTSQVTFTSATADSDPTCSQCIDVDKIKSGVVVVNTDGATKTNYIAGQTSTYTITVTNYDAAAATNVAIQDLVAAGINPADVSWTGNGKSGTGDLVDTIASLGPNQTITYTVVVKVPSNFDQKTNLVNEVTYSVNGVPNSTVCVQCKDTDTPNPFADLQINKTDNQTQFYFNSTNTYTIVVSNSGPSDATNLVVEDKIPPGITVMTWSGSNGKSGSGTLNDVIPNLAVGQVVTYIVNISIGKSYSPPDPSNPSVPLVNLTNTVKVTSDTPDPVVACPGCSDVDSPRSDFVTVDVNRFTTEQLVKDVLINSPCVNISEFTSTLNCGFGYFNRNNSDFPIKEGMIIRGGNAVSSQGKYDNSAISTVCSAKPDAELQAINCSNGNCGSINDASSVKFKFVAGGDNFSFRYLFASNEYGTYQCGYSDAFAFILTDVTPGVTPPPVSHNLAVIPGTATATYDGIPVSVTNIRKKIYNTGCADAHPQFFGQYNAGDSGGSAANIAASDINMKGQTVVLTATSKVIPGHIYTIKMVIGDYNDTAFDSAVFIEAGSFDIGFPDVKGPGGVSDNLELCAGKQYVLQSGTTKLPGITYSWKFNGTVIPGANTYFITIDKPGVYTVVYTYAVTGCQQSDDFNVIPAPIPALQEPNDLFTCVGNTFDLTKNVQVVLGTNNPDDYDINYYHTQADADNATNAILNFTAYPGGEGESIFMAVEFLGAAGKCVPVKSFKLHFTPAASGTISYVEDGGAPGFCRNSNPALAVTKSTPFTEGGVYSVTPSTGLTIDAATGTLNLTNSIPGDYVVNYKVAASSGCPEYNTTTNVKINACVTVVMDPIAAICAGDAVVLTCTDAGTGVVYTWSDASGVLGTTTVPTFTLAPAPTVAGSYTYTVVVSFGAENSAPSSQVLVVNATPEASISGSGNICSGQSTEVTFTGTPGSFVTYNDGTADATIQLSTGSVGTYVLTTPNLTTNITYKLVSVAANTTPSCQQNLAGAPNSVVTITAIDAPTATVSFGSASTLCMGEATDVVFSGTPGAEVVYTKNGVTQNLTLNASGQQKIIGTGILNEDTEYTIVSVTSGSAECVGYPVSSITIDVVEIPEPAMKQKGSICVDPNTGETTRTFKLDTGLDTAQFTFAWYFQEDGQSEVPLGSTQNFYDADKVGQYKVVVTDNGPLQCKRTSIASVTKSVPPLGVVAEVVSGYFEDNATVIATAAPSPPAAGTTYEYAMDNGPFQDSNEFKNVSYGLHVVHARDKEACADVTSTVTVINFPRYFTPNGDGYNDEWNISVLSDQPNAKIYIFDRFGKLLKQISPQGAGWDGTYNGRPMPADDYWFVVKYQEQLIDKEFKAHFTLKR